jgi:Tfp pilus assembly protein FimV
MDTKKIKECLESFDISSEERKNKAKEILDKMKDETKNKSDLARLYVYIGDYEEAVNIYIKSGDYRKFYQYINKLSKEFIEL